MHITSVLCCRTGCAPSVSLLPFVAVVRACAQARSILWVVVGVVLSSSERARERALSPRGYLVCLRRWCSFRLSARYLVCHLHWCCCHLGARRARERAQSGVLWSLSVG
jgi:hypothetical protein